MIFSTENITHKFSKYVYLDEVKAIPKEFDVFSVLSMNIRTLASSLQIVIDQCLPEESNMDIMGFSETRLDNNIENLYKLRGYNMFTMNRDKKGEGVCIYETKRDEPPLGLLNRRTQPMQHSGGEWTTHLLDRWVLLLGCEERS